MTDTVLDRFGLAGGVAVVTGAGRGIGEGIAIGLAQAGCDVVLTARREHEINAVAEAVRQLGRRSVAIAGDITDGAFVDSLAERAKAEMGRVTLWVSNAGGADDRDCAETGGGRKNWVNSPGSPTGGVDGPAPGGWFWVNDASLARGAGDAPGPAVS